MTVRNQYHVLGIEPGCTKNEIRKAYRLSALKYHPDKKNGSNKKFIEVKEAYDLLIDDNLRTQHDIDIGFKEDLKNSKIEPNKNTNSGNESVPTPEIVHLLASKYSFEIGDSIIFSWKVKNADKIELIPFGLVHTEGRKRVIIKRSNGIKLIVKLVATNTSTGQSASRIIQITKIITQDLNFIRKPANKKRAPTTFDKFFALFYPCLMSLIFLPISVFTLYDAVLTFTYQDHFRFFICLFFFICSSGLLCVFTGLIFTRLKELKDGTFS